jgi:hypothetical protein
MKTYRQFRQNALLFNMHVEFSTDHEEVVMHTTGTERRSNTDAATPTREYDAQVVRRGLLVQRDMGTISAIEFLKAGGVEAAIIQRVLSGNAMRAEDREALAALQSAAQP